MKLIDQWRAYTGPRDERVVAEANRIYRTCYVMLTFGMLVIFYYDGLVKQVAAVADFKAGGSGSVVYSPFEIMVFAWFILSCVVGAVLLCRKGLADDGSRFSETELFPGGYFSLVSGIVSVSVGIAVMLMRVLAEIQVNGLGAVDGATWLVGAVMGLVIGLLLFGALMAAFYLSFRAAKRRRVAIEAKLSD